MPTSKYNNNFNLMRLILAILVIYSHSYFILGINSTDSFLELIGLNVGGLRVKCFFIISGYLVYKSIEKSNSYIHFLWKRFLRIFPALSILIISTILICYFFSNNKSQYLLCSDTWHYLKNLSPNFIIRGQAVYTIESVFTQNKTQIINGSLWSIPVEVKMYLLLTILYFFRKSNLLSWAYTLTMISIFYLSIFPRFQNIMFFERMHLWTLDLGVYFWIGVFFSKINLEKFLQNKRLLSAGIGTLLLLILSRLSYGNLLLPFTLPFFILSLCFLNFKNINNIFSSIGDPSYGIYLWGFLVQQIIVALFYKHLNIFTFNLLSIPVSILLGIASWHVIEKKALSFKNLRFTLFKFKRSSAK